MSLMDLFTLTLLPFTYEPVALTSTVSARYVILLEILVEMSLRKCGVFVNFKNRFSLSYSRRP